MDDGWVLVGPNSNTIKIPVVMSFYEVICDIIKKTRDDQGAFLFYLMVFNQKQVVQNIRKYWVLQFAWIIKFSNLKKKERFLPPFNKELL